jgi:hypothetical protein
VPAASWAACVVALLGSCLITADSMVGANGGGSGGGGGSSSGESVEPPARVAEQREPGAGGRRFEAAEAPPLADGAVATSRVDSTLGAGTSTDAAASASGSSSSSSLAAASGLADSGSSDSQPAPPAGEAAPQSGDGFVLLACVFYALATVRLSVHAPRHGAAALTATKSVVLAAASTLWLLLSQAPAGGAPGLLPPEVSHGAGLAVLVYSALGPGALAAYLQTRGQATVGAPQAQVVFSLTPLWAAGLALGLDGEGMGPLAWGGAGAILAATAGVAVASAREGGGGGTAATENTSPR